MAPLGPEVRVPEDLQEVRTMLVTRMERWVEQKLPHIARVAPFEFRF